jgi:hypothetical protein
LRERVAISRLVGHWLVSGCAAAGHGLFSLAGARGGGDVGPVEVIEGVGEIIFERL